MSEYDRQYLAANRDKINEQRRRRYRDNPDQWRATKLHQLYGLTIEEYRVLHDEQEGKCLICGQECQTGRMLSVDHDHNTGKVRGLLCQNCNTGIGKFKDDPDLLKKAISYLERNK
jgi:predicted alpha/beta-hydrolase family hydrolase